MVSVSPGFKVRDDEFGPVKIEMGVAAELNGLPA